MAGCMQAGRAATEAGPSSGAILARVHAIVERMLGKAVGAHQVWATWLGYIETQSSQLTSCMLAPL